MIWILRLGEGEREWSALDGVGLCPAELSLVQMEMGLLCFVAFEAGFSSNVLEGEVCVRLLTGEDDVSGLSVRLGSIKGMIWILWRGEEGPGDGDRPPRGGGGGVLVISALDASMLSSLAELRSFND